MLENYNAKVFIAIPVLLIGGTEIQTLNLANVLIGAGYDVSVCCYYEYEPEMVKRFEAAGAEVLLMKYDRASGLWHLAKGLIRLFKQLKPDIIHVQYVAPGFVPVVAARVAGVKTIFATVHQPGRTYGRMAKLLLRRAARMCTAFFCSSRSVEASWFGDSMLFDPHNSKGARRHWTIYNAVDTDRISRIVADADRQALRAAVGLGDRPVIGFVGRIRWEKGLDILIDALPHILNKHPHAVLIVAGDGPDRMNLELRAKSLGLASNILWLGQKSPEEVYRLYSIVDVVAVPSLFEGFGLSAAEAMAAGLPVVAARVDGLSEVIEDRASGFLFHRGDSLGLAKAISDLFLDPQKANEMGEMGYTRVKNNFSYERLRELTISAYECFS